MLGYKLPFGPRGAKFNAFRSDLVKLMGITFKKSAVWKDVYQTKAFQATSASHMVCANLLELVARLPGYKGQDSDGRAYGPAAPRRFLVRPVVEIYDGTAVPS